MPNPYKLFTFYKIQPYVHSLFTCVIFFLGISLTGCGKLGPTTLEWERNNYNIAVQKTNDEQLLLNLVRLKYRDTPFFLEVSSIASQLTLRSNASVNATLEKAQNAIFGLGAGMALEERPTVTYAPLQGEKFIMRVLSPISLETIALLYHSGWSIERILRLTLQRIHNLKNAPGASGPTPKLAPDFEAFTRAAKLLRFFQANDALKVSLVKENDKPVLVLKISQKAKDWPETRELSGYFSSSPDTLRYILSPFRSTSSLNHIQVESRSLLGIMFYLSQAVESSSKDLQDGKITATRHASGKPFDWNKMMGDLFRVYSVASNPSASSVKINYRGQWFYISDSDLISKSTFSLLSQIFSLQAGKIKSTAPLLTLPIGQ